MAPPSQETIEEKLAALQTNFKLTLSTKIEEIEQLWNSIIVGEENKVVIADCHRMAHTLVGSGGTFGAIAVSTSSRELEQALNLLIISENNITNEYKVVVSNLIINLKHIANNWQPSKIPYLKPLAEVDTLNKKNNLIYLAEDNELLAEELIVQLQDNGFIVKHFIELDSFAEAFTKEIPSAIIMDIVFEEGDVAGADKISELKKQLDFFPPVIFISVRNDIQARLAAAAAGAQRYFTKPIDVNKLSQTLDGLIERTAIKPFRILFVDDDENLLTYYETVLLAAGLEVRTLSNPLNCLDVLEEFNPDVIVLDVYMPECTGPELARVIRQDDKWSITPIMFLSTETDIDVQLDAMNLGGESFMLKPITARHLLSVVTAKSKYSRWNHRINNDLKMALRESEFQVITSDQHDIVSTADVMGKIVSVNDKFCEISGYNREELIGQNHRLLKSHHHPASFYKDMWATISSGQVWHGTICNLNKQGIEYWVDSTIVPFLDDKGKPYKYVSARTDVTAVIQSEERLERSQEFANIGTWDWNIETGDLFWSDRIWPLFGYDKEVTATTYDNFMAAIHPDDRELVSKGVSRCVENEEDYDIEHRVVWSDGSIHWLHESGDVLRSASGKPLHMLGVVQDITTRKEAERTINEAREEAETANRAKSQFLSSMSHELRTPMNAIMGFGQLLNMEIGQPLDDSQKENVGEILKASDHLLELINEVLDLSRIEAGRIDLSVEDVQVGEVIVASLQLILPLAEKRGICIKLLRGTKEVEFSDLSSEQNIVRADITRLKQIVINLLSNAVKYNSEGGTITITCANSQDNNLRISVTDTGQGLDKEQSEQLFTAFNRLGAENSEIEGTGIGLVITKNIVELMGGKIGVESKVGVGSTFWFELPGSSGSVDKKVEESSSAININLDEERTILYIEDNPANLRLVTQVLGRLPNIRLWSAHEGKLGLELAMEYVPDLILLDINLPGLNGYDVLERLKQHKSTAEIPVIAISANAMTKDIERGYAAGFNEYITKPIDINKLISSVDKHLKPGS